jgi:cytochrome b pre-mRNA-processing protein 3
MTGLAQKLREKAPLMTETYVAYGATRDLMKECTKAGEYKIPQAQIKGGEIPTDENGVHLGEGEGWWYESKFFRPLCLVTEGFFGHAGHPACSWQQDAAT